MKITNDQSDSFVNCLDEFDVSTKFSENHKINKFDAILIVFDFWSIWCLFNFRAILPKFGLCQLLVLHLNSICTRCSEVFIVNITVSSQSLPFIFQEIQFFFFFLFLCSFFSFRLFCFSSSKWLSVDFRWVEEEETNFSFSRCWFFLFSLFTF